MFKEEGVKGSKGIQVAGMHGGHGHGVLREARGRACTYRRKGVKGR
jgi:hypothetical protein